MVEILDNAVIDALVNTYAENPEGSGTRKAETDALVALYAKRDKAQSVIRQIGDDREVGIYTQADAARRIAKHSAEVDALTAKIDKARASSAHAAMLDATWESLYRKVLDKAPFLGAMDVEPVVMRSTLAMNFLQLDLEQQRNLVRGSLSISVSPGRGSERIAITAK